MGGSNLYLYTVTSNQPDFYL